jgi:hypothetical protein
MSMDDFNLSKKFIYPYNPRWILFSFILTCSCFILAAFSLGEKIPLFSVYTLIVAAMFIPIKYSLYRRLKEKIDHPLIPTVDPEAEPGTVLNTILLVTIVILGLVVPFLILAFVDPITWFILLLGFIAGMNLPELVLFAYSHLNK